MSATTPARAYLDTAVTSEPSERQDTTAGGNGRGCSGLSAASRQSSLQHCACVMHWCITRGKCSLLVGPEYTGGDGFVVLEFWCDSHWVG